MSDLSDALAQRGRLIGTMITMASGTLVEALSRSGLDWLFFDLEHSVMRLDEVQAMIQAMSPDCLAVIRVEEPSTLSVKRALDTGCAAVIVPQVNNLQLAQTVVAAGKFPPQGARGVGLCRAVGYGATLAERVVSENTRTSLIVQIEHIEALRDLQEIAALDGIDALFVGPYDLSGSLGIPGQIDDERVQDAIVRVIEAGRSVGKPVGIFVGAGEAAAKEFARGVSFAVVGADIPHLVAATKDMMATARR